MSKQTQKSERLLSEATEKKLKAHIGKLYSRMSLFCTANGFSISDYNKTIRLIPGPKSLLVIEAIEKKGTKVPKGKRKLLLVDNERASRLKINKETVDEFNPTA
ncbi:MULTISPECIES: hypothetical protein [Leptospira]|uniref:hypothetical protein n=1 Tax=Leptospira TaxID=171 RepID=UPI000377F43C|nr:MULTISPECIES: hypothetical protein [Leptospira]UML79126.1 hypothetical protein FH602_12325 [Leptospira kirschneri]UML80383.1 hypothetical protein FH602_19395 [Leptospira kirschneri]UMQ54077.1 hypothetical protein FH582_19540 [Leptospira interrogans]